MFKPKDTIDQVAMILTGVCLALIVLVIIFVDGPQPDSPPVYDPQLGAIVSTTRATVVTATGRVAIGTAYSTTGGS